MPAEMEWECCVVYDGEDDGDWRKIRAYSAEAAAEIAAEKRDQWDAEYHDERTVRVKDKDGEVRTYVVTAESTRVYRATEADNAR